MCGFAGVIAPPSSDIGRGWTAWASSQMVRRCPDGGRTLRPPVMPIFEMGMEVR